MLNLPALITSYAILFTAIMFIIGTTSITLWLSYRIFQRWLQAPPSLFSVISFTIPTSAQALLQLVKKSFMTRLSYWIFQHWLQAPPSQLISTPSPWLGWPQPRYKSRGWPGAHRAAVKLPSLIWGPLQSQGLFLTAEKPSKTHLVSIRLPKKGYFFISGILC